MELKGLLGGLRSFEYEWFCGQLLKIIREIWSVKLGSVRSTAIISKGTTPYGGRDRMKKHWLVRSSGT
jgi:hypothetical protein